MTTILDLVNLLLDCISSFKKASLGSFTLSFAVAAVLSTVCWFVCAKWTFLWNKRFHARPLHHWFCGVASTLTFIFVIAFAGLSFLKPVADLAVQRWSAMLAFAGNGTGAAIPAIVLSDNERKRAARWQAETFLKARHEVFIAQKSGLEPQQPFSSSEWRKEYHVDPSYAALLRDLAAANGWTLAADEVHTAALEDGGNLMPGEGRLGEIAARTYAEEAISLFRETNPFLSRIVWPPSSRISKDLIDGDIQQFFRTNEKGVNYPCSRAIEIARQQVLLKLSEQTPRVVTMGRLALVGLFLFAQAIPFCMIGWAAYRDLKAYRSVGLHHSASAARAAAAGGAAARHRLARRHR
jgi:hypothetical protein